MTSKRRCTGRYSIGMGMSERCGLTPRHRGDHGPAPRLRAILPSTPPDEYPDMRDVEKSIREHARDAPRPPKRADRQSDAYVQGLEDVRAWEREQQRRKP